MIKFEVNKTYHDKNNNSYTVLNRTKDTIECRFNRVIKKYHVVKYCNIETVIQYGSPLIMADKIHYQFDDEIDGSSIKRKQINKENMGYIDVIRRRI